jgi:hypothetical protein
VSSLVLARGFTALNTFSATWITGSMFTAALGASYRIAAITLTRHGVSIISIISTEMK